MGITALQRVRLAAKLTQRELAEKASVSQQYIALLEGGYGYASEWVKEKIANVLGVSKWTVFPEMRIKMDIYALLKSRFSILHSISEQKAIFIKEVLSQLNENDFCELIMNHMTFSSAWEKMKVYAKKLNINEALRQLWDDIAPNFYRLLKEIESHED